MKKILILVLLICVCCLNSIYIFADYKSNATGNKIQNINTSTKEPNIYDGLPELDLLYTRKEYSELTDYANQLMGHLKSQRTIINTLGSLYYLGYANEKLDTVKLRELLLWKSKNDHCSSPLFDSNFFNEYNELRLSELNDKLKGKAIYDYIRFITNSKIQYDEFINVTVLDEAIEDKMILLLQDKLLDRMLSETVEDKEKYFKDILSLRLEDNKNRSWKYVYEIFESRVRLYMLEKMLDNNMLIVRQLMDKVNINLSDLEYSDHNVVLEDEAVSNNIMSDIIDERFSVNENSARLIIEDINKYKIYRLLKDKGINNRVTVSFEDNKEAWIQNLKILFNSFTEVDNQQQYADQSFQMSKFVIFIKNFVDYSRTIDNSDVEDRKSILKFRQSVLQFMPIEETISWILDNLYAINMDIN